jgi:hypothetical protein
MCHFDLPPDLSAILSQALVEGAELRELLPPRCIDRHLAVVEVLSRIRDGESVSPSDLDALRERTRADLDEIANAMRMDFDPEDEQPPARPPLVLGTPSWGQRGLRQTSSSSSA